jgi:hypothetical protein
MESNVSVEIVVNRDGVAVVRYRGDSLNDEPEANRIYQSIRHLVTEIDRTVKIAKLPN